jgi:predicted phage tail protein
MEKEIRLYGPLAKFIGQRKFLAEISSAGEAIRMLLANFPDWNATWLTSTTKSLLIVTKAI